MGYYKYNKNIEKLTKMLSHVDSVVANDAVTSLMKKTVVIRLNEAIEMNKQRALANHLGRKFMFRRNKSDYINLRISALEKHIMLHSNDLDSLKYLDIFKKAKLKI